MFDLETFFGLLGLKPGVSVARVLPEANYGVGVSTALTSDFGYETALLDANGVIPVERYPDEESARAGHERWIISSRTLESVWNVWDEKEVAIARLPFGVGN
jgi:hypothetical protein